LVNPRLLVAIAGLALTGLVGGPLAPPPSRVEAAEPEQPGGDLVINEVLADNKTGITDPAGQYADWVEIHNRGNQAIHLADYYLSDKADEPQIYAFPDEVLAPGGYYLVWCDNDPNQGPDHADFKLDKEGESVYLSTEAAIVDSVAFGPQETDVSWGRSRDGAAAWGRCARPSPRVANACAGEVEVTPTASPATPTPASPTPTATATLPPITPVAWAYLPVTESGE
jgi:hypothetical protein